MRDRQCIKSQKFFRVYSYTDGRTWYATYFNPKYKNELYLMSSASEEAAGEAVTL
jgi:hypothetical protein